VIARSRKCIENGRFMFGLATQRTFANVGKRHHRLSANWHFGTFDFWHTGSVYVTRLCGFCSAVALVARSPERKPLYQSAPPVRLCSHVCSLNATLTARLSPTAFFEKAKKHPSCVTNLARKFLRHNRTSTATACEATASPKRQQGVALMMQHTSAVGQP
jgi:hypothetical protein